MLPEKGAQSHQNELGGGEKSDGDAKIRNARESRRKMWNAREQKETKMNTGR